MHPDLRRDLLALLRNKHLAPLLEDLHASLARNGEPKGRVEIRSRDEADALQDLIGKWVEPGRTIGVRDIDERLREQTVFHCSLDEAIELHRGAPIPRPKEERARRIANRERAVRQCFELLPTLGVSTEAYARVVGWMHAGEPELRADATRWGDQALLEGIRAVALAFHRLPAPGAPPVYLAELANQVTGNAHGLDAGKPAHALLIRALAFTFPETAAREERGSAAWKLNLLSAAGIARDPISVRVDTFGLDGDTPYLRELRREGIDRPFTLNTLAEIGGDVRAWRNVAFVVENPTVLAALIKHVRQFVPDNHPTLICTNGNLNLADKALLDALVQRGAHLFYGGDFDAKGLEIAALVLARYPGAASPWRMTMDDYRDALRTEGGALEPGALDRAARTFPALAAEIAARGQAAHQEGLIPALTRDLSRFVLEGVTPPQSTDPPGESLRSVHRP
ncbi:DUF2399 domain-containing protein [Longimicrobium sp.]|jgi:uncharacterized protein (TIGR02679 family)|uniref:DUF2399 domain-containing protein n=1 Tax=Longimicrobium sp. TaxID=2029185 RepID=UPI002ED827D1